MPNIEIHGMTQEFLEQSATTPIGAREKIREIFKDAPYAGDMVVTTVQDDVRSLDGRPEPYIRILSTPDDEVAEIIAKLKSVWNVDIEHVYVAEFFPRAIPRLPPFRKVD